MDPWKFKTSSGIGSPGEADRAGLDSFLDIEIDKSISMPEEYTSRGRCSTSLKKRTAVWDAPTVPLAERESPFRGDREGDEK